MPEPLLYTIVAFIGLAGLLLAFYLMGRAFAGAVFLFFWAMDWGFIGLAAYVAAWVFLLPFMAVASLIFGFIVLYEGRDARDNLSTETQRPVTEWEERLYDEPLSEYEKQRGY